MMMEIKQLKAKQKEIVKEIRAIREGGDDDNVEADVTEPAATLEEFDCIEEDLQSKEKIKIKVWNI
jgi:hypothetical protein